MDTLAIDYKEDLIQVTNFIGLGNLVKDVFTNPAPHKLVLLRDEKIIYEPVYSINDYTWQAIYINEVKLVVNEKRVIQQAMTGSYVSSTNMYSYTMEYYSSTIMVHSAYSGELIEYKIFEFDSIPNLPYVIDITKANDTDKFYISWNDIERYLITLMNKDY